MNEKPIGIAKQFIGKGETIAMVNLLTGEVTSDNKDFLPEGKEALLNMISLPKGFEFIPNRREMNMEKAKEFKEVILQNFKESRKTGWGKNEIVSRIKDLWNEMKTNFWYQVWKAQGGRCFKCARPIRFDQVCKKAESFDIICQDCYSEPEEQTLFIIDEADTVDDLDWKALENTIVKKKGGKTLRTPSQGKVLLTINF